MHHHSHHVNDEMPFKEKAAKLIGYWIKHNEDHMNSYKERGEEAKESGYDEICGIFNEAASMTDKINEKLKEALKKI